MRDELLANQAVLLRRCDDFEVDLAQAKRKAATDAGVIEYLRKQVLDLQEAARNKVSERARWESMVAAVPSLCWRARCV